MHRLTRLVAVGLCALGVPLAGAAAAESRPGGTVWAYVSAGSGAVSQVILTGAIGDYGTATNIDKDGKVDADGGYLRVRLSKGGFEANAIELSDKSRNAALTSGSEVTCSANFVASAPVTLFDGSGQYAGISGTIRVTAIVASIDPRYLTGARKGQCDLSEHADPLAFARAITGKGTVRFG